MLWSITLLAVLATAQGRAVNISNTWMLPEEGFPVFYRHFRDRISWYEADAVCQFHHANLVTVDTTAQYDAVRAYLKELDITNAVWVGLIRSNPDGEFTWTDYRGLSSDGYWSSAPDSGSAPLCAAADPAADYRWEARACGGPMVASFICELPVPTWATGSEGCMVKSLPALTALYLPESAAVQLTADCGLAGVKRVQCTGNVKREELLKQLSCGDEDNDTLSTLASDFIINNSVSTTANIVPQDQYTISETIIPSSSKIVIEENPQTGEKIVKINEDLKSAMTIETKLAEKEDNLESNEIPKIEDVNNFIKESPNFDDDFLRKDTDIHEKLAHLGNPEGFEKIFSQSSDHFIPPLVIAKAKMSDDMMELSLAEKHAQQLAEVIKSQHFVTLKQETTEEPSISTEGSTIKETLTTNMPSSTTPKWETEKKTDKPSKYSIPKKYKDKYDYKMKIMNTNAKKRIEKVSDITTTSKTIQEEMVTDSNIAPEKEINVKSSVPDLPPIELTVILNDRKNTEDNKTPKEYVTEGPLGQATTEAKTPEIMTTKTYVTETSTEQVSEKVHEVIQITIPNKKNASGLPIAFEFTTVMPTSEITTNTDQLNMTSEKTKETSILPNTEAPDTATRTTSSAPSENISSKPTLEPATVPSTSEPSTTITTPIFKTSTFIADTSTKTDASAGITEKTTTGPANIDVNTTGATVIGDKDEEMLDVSHSPLLSAANEPLHRPNRLRRPSQPISKLRKFNPFRILG